MEEQFKNKVNFFTRDYLEISFSYIDRADSTVHLVGVELYQGNSHQFTPAENMVAAGTGHGRSGRNDAKFTGIVRDDSSCDTHY